MIVVLSPELKAWLARPVVKLLTGSILVGAIGAALVNLEPVAAFEEELGLRLLFALRGPRVIPDDAVIVSMTRDAPHTISLPNDPEKFHRCIGMHFGDVPPDYQLLHPLPTHWPRCVFARLIDALVRAGADTIAVDAVFRPRPPLMGLSGADQDQALARAIRSGKKVILAQKLIVRHTLPVSQTGEEEVEVPAILSEAVENASFGVAPVLLWESAYRRINGFGTFKNDDWIGAGMPVVALQAYALDVLPDLQRLLQAVAPELVPDLQRDVRSIVAARQLQVLSLLLRQLVVAHPGIAEKLKQELSSSHWQALPMQKRRLLTALIETYSGEDFRYLNFYGRPGAIPTVRFDDLLMKTPRHPKTMNLRGKVVFVGFSERGQSDAADHHPTPVSRGDQVDTSGVEMGAIALLNLLDGSSLSRANWQLVGCLVFILGFGLAAVVRGLPTVLGTAGAVLICVGYVIAVVWCFGRQYVWFPLVTPISLCVPLVAMNSVVLRFVDVHLERERMFEAIKPFLPAGLVDQMRKNAAAIAPASASLHGVCVATDAKQFTTLVESMPQEELERFMNGYYEALFTPVASNGGVVSDTAGDAMIAVFPVRSHETDVRAKAAVACLEILASTDRFNQTSEKGQLPTRIGVDFGAVTLAVLGTKARREYHAIGDPVNTASRLQELNKHLGTSLLVSDHVVANVSGLLTRDIGTYLLRGKRLPIHAHELRGALASSTETDRSLCERFGEALARLNYGDREGGEAALRALLADYPGDGPTLFYLRRIRDGEPFPNDGMKVD